MEVSTTDNHDVDKILNTAMMYLIETAAKDGIITEEEKELLDALEISLRKYKHALQQAYEDGRITALEEKQLEKVKDTIMDSGREFAAIDGISKDEMNLLISVMLSLQVPKSNG